MKTGISTFIAAIVFLLLGTSNIEAQNVYFKKNGVTVFQSAVSGIDSIVFYNPVESLNNDSIGFVEPTNNFDPFIFTDAKENSFVAFFKNQETGIIKRALFIKNNESFIMIYGVSGLPIGMYADGYYFLFSNYIDKSVNISVYNENKEFISKATVENEDIFNLIQEANSLSLKNSMPLRSDPSDDELINEMDRQASKVATLGVSAFSCAAPALIGKLNGIGCLSALIAHINYFWESVYPESYNKDNFLSRAGELLDLADCLKGFTDPTKLDKLANIPSCILTVVQKFTDLEEEHYNNLSSLIDSWDIEIPSKDVSDYMKITTKVTNISSDSALVIGELSLFGDGHRNYSIRFQGVQWGYYADLQNGIQIDPTSASFSIPIKNLSPDTQYGARAFLITDYYKDWWGKDVEANETVYGDPVYFRTLPQDNFLNLSTYAINFKKEGGTEPINIETNCEITDISFFVQPVDNWCSFSYDESTKSISVSAKANTTNSPRPQVTLEVKAKCSNGEPKSKLVLINQEAGVAETGDWVLINGVCWATCNVGAKNPEDFGGYYQWNTSSFLGNDYWKSNYWNSTSWQPANDPSPAGYRVPTQTELQSLLNTTNVSSSFTTLNGVYGLKFTDKKNGNNIFLPAAGQRSSGNGTLYYVGSHCFYWSATYSEDYGEGAGAYELYFGSTLYGTYGPWIDWDSQSMGFSIRPVAK